MNFVYKCEYFLISSYATHTIKVNRCCKMFIFFSNKYVLFSRLPFFLSVFYIKITNIVLAKFKGLSLCKVFLPPLSLSLFLDNLSPFFLNIRTSIHPLQLTSSHSLGGWSFSHCRKWLVSYITILTICTKSEIVFKWELLLLTQTSSFLYRSSLTWNFIIQNNWMEYIMRDRYDGRSYLIGFSALSYFGSSALHM